MIARMSIWFAAILVFGGVLSGCATTNAAQLAADEAKAKLVMQDIAADAAPVGLCTLQVVVTVAAAVTTGNWLALAGLEPCIANAVSMIQAQVAAGKASPPPLANVQTAQTIHAVVKAASATAAK